MGSLKFTVFNSSRHSTDPCALFRSSSSSLSRCPIKSTACLTYAFTVSRFILRLLATVSAFLFSATLLACNLLAILMRRFACAACLPAFRFSSAARAVISCNVLVWGSIFCSFNSTLLRTLILDAAGPLNPRNRTNAPSAHAVIKSHNLFVSLSPTASCIRCFLLTNSSFIISCSSLIFFCLAWVASLPCILWATSLIFSATASAALSGFLNFLRVISIFTVAIFICSGLCVGKTSLGSTRKPVIAGSSSSFTSM